MNATHHQSARGAVASMAMVVAIILALWVHLTGGARAEGALPSVVSVEAEQVARGRGAYARHCALCHGDRLEGMDHFPQLVGALFQRRWGGKTVGELYTYVFETMPLGDGASLEVETYADILAFLLERNGALVSDIPFDPTDAAQAASPLHFHSGD
jgi:cytochrome c